MTAAASRLLPAAPRDRHPANRTSFIVLRTPSPASPTLPRLAGRPPAPKRRRPAGETPCVHRRAGPYLLGPKSSQMVRDPNAWSDEDRSLRRTGPGRNPTAPGRSRATNRGPHRTSVRREPSPGPSRNSTPSAASAPRAKRPMPGTRANRRSVSLAAPRRSEPAPRTGRSAEAVRVFRAAVRRVSTAETPEQSRRVQATTPAAIRLRTRYGLPKQRRLPDHASTRRRSRAVAKHVSRPMPHRTMVHVLRKRSLQTSARCLHQPRLVIRRTDDGHSRREPFRTHPFVRRRVMRTAPQ